jgi:hypothetical protein
MQVSIATTIFFHILTISPFLLIYLSRTAWLNVAVEWFALLICVPELTDSDFYLETSYFNYDFFRFFSFPPGI